MASVYNEQCLAKTASAVNRVTQTSISTRLINHDIDNTTQGYHTSRAITQDHNMAITVYRDCEMTHTRDTVDSRGQPRKQQLCRTRKPRWHKQVSGQLPMAFICELLLFLLTLQTIINSSFPVNYPCCFVMITSSEYPDNIMWVCSVIVTALARTRNDRARATMLVTTSKLLVRLG